MAEPVPACATSPERECAKSAVPGWAWALVAVLAAVDIAWLALTPLRLADWQGMVVINACAAAGLAIMGYRHLADPSLRVLAIGMAFMLVAWPTLRLFNHLTMTTDLPYADAQLAAWDALIGFDWLAYVRWVEAQPLLLRLMDLCYEGLTLYSCVTFIAILTWAGAERAREFLLLFLITAVAVSVIGMIFPAKAAMIHYAPDARLFVNIGPNTGTYHMAALNALRSDAAHTLSLTNLPGLVTFPSFHTAMGVISIYCARGRPGLLLPVVIVNSLMIASTPVFGSHYLIDVIAGAVLVAVMVPLLRLIEARAFSWARKSQEEPGFDKLSPSALKEA